MLSPVDVKLATLIDIKAAPNHESNLADFLKSAALLVRQTEANTKLWLALQKDSQNFGIFDVFADQKSREDHFAGQVAHRLRKNSTTLVRDGWENGVLSNLQNFEVLSARLPINIERATEATFIKLNANEGLENQLAALLTSAANLIAQTEPNTLLWLGLKLDNYTFGIFDIFSDQYGREAHFAGQVAAMLKAQSKLLVKGGWDDGVVKNVHNYQIIATA